MLHPPPLAGSIDAPSRAWPQVASPSLPVLFLILGGAVVMLPYLLLPVIPGNDYPNHLARLAVLGAAPGSPLRQNFVPHWALMPDLGLDLVFMALKSFASPLAVLRLCLAGSFAIMLASLCAIQRTLYGRVSFAAAMTPLFVAGLPAVMGYANYIMSCAALMAGIALYLAWRDRLKPPHLAVLAAIGAVTWLCHVAGFGVFVVFIGTSHTWASLYAWRPARLRRRCLEVFAIALPGLLMSVLSEKGVAGVAHWRPLLLMRSLVAPVAASGTPADLLLWLGAVLLLACVFFRASWTVAPQARASLRVLALMVVLLPAEIGSAFDIGSRIAVPTMLLLLACSSITLPPFGTGRWALLAGLSILFVVRFAAVMENGLHEASTVQSFRAAITTMPQGAALMVASDRWRNADCSAAENPFPVLGAQSHLGAYATLDRAAWTPFIFAERGRQPLSSAKHFPPGALPTMPPPPLDWLTTAATAASHGPADMPPGWPGRYDYLLVLGHGCPKNPIPALLQPDAAGPGYTLYRLRKPTG